jgi:hypothetical protein
MSQMFHYYNPHFTVNFRYHNLISALFVLSFDSKIDPVSVDTCTVRSKLYIYNICVVFSMRVVLYPIKALDTLKYYLFTRS